MVFRFSIKMVKSKVSMKSISNAFDLLLRFLRWRGSVIQRESERERGWHKKGRITREKK
jgi:hypothetical protein